MKTILQICAEIRTSLLFDAIHSAMCGKVWADTVGRHTQAAQAPQHFWENTTARSHLFAMFT